MELTLGTSSAAGVASGVEAYAIANDAHEVIDRPLSRLNPIDAANARSYEGTEAYKQCPALVERFVTKTGTRSNREGAEVLNTFMRLGQLERLKGVVPTPATQAYCYPQDAEGNIVSNASPIATRLWTVVPEVDLSAEGAIESYLATGKFPFRVVPAGQTAEQYPTSTKDGKVMPKPKSSVKQGMTLSIPRVAYKNCLIVDVTTEADGTVIPTKVRAAYYLRAKFVDREHGKVNVPNIEVPVWPSLFASVWERQAIDITDDALSIYSERVGEFNGDIDKTMHAVFETLFADPAFAQSSAHKVLELIARMTTASMVEGLPREVRRAHNLDDRMRLYAIELYDCYYGIEREASEGSNEFTDFHGRLASLSDPLRLKARNLQGKTRINNGASVVLFQ